ncbi:MAG TPA: serine hydrolase domain-containing protein [Thermoanaerobaculia bacterium]|nr:serine hydrolase domain-containing protein [Thermoanaerobaculia bacterium]
MSRVGGFLRKEIAKESFPGAVALVASRDAILETAHAGYAAVEPESVPTAPETLYDVASLTKPLCAGELARIGTQSGLSLDLAPGRFFPGWKRTRYDGITLRMLLTHTAGLPPWRPLYVKGEGADAYRRTLCEIEPETRPGEAVIYSDLGFLVLGEVLEAFFSSPLDRCFATLVAEPAGSGARFLPTAYRSTAATEKDDRTEREMTEALGLSYSRFRRGVVWGDVHDGNAFRRGGVSANAGLFASAEDVWRLARSWLDPGRAQFVQDSTPDCSEARALSWQGRRGAGSAIEKMSPRAFGHTGFTGTSVWIDPEPARVYVLLSNRVHPEARDGDFNAVRRRFHEVASEEFSG